MIDSDNGDLGNHLSRNIASAQYLETDGERLLMTLQAYMMKKGRTGSAEVVTEYLKKLGSDQNSAMGQIFNHEETVEYMQNLHDFGTIFHYHKTLTAKWIQHHLHNISGGVSCSGRQYGICTDLMSRLR